MHLRLITQCKNYSIPFKDGNEICLSDYDLVIDSIFGFSFKSDGEIREPYGNIIKSLSVTGRDYMIASIDIPSGWDINKEKQEDQNSNTFTPDILISLTLPKLCAKDFKGLHYIAGRFVPKRLYEKFKLIGPEYRDAELFMQILD